jgi:DNA-binding winged helix-turn-helix (wHTH) protein
MLKPDKHLYEFGPFRLDIGECVLLRDGEVVPLTPKAVDLFVALVENSGHVLSKDELMKLVWPDSFVEEANLLHQIFSLRKALGEDGKGIKCIETIPRRGYRFVAHVTAIGIECCVWRDLYRKCSCMNFRNRSQSEGIVPCPPACMT